MQRRNLVSKWFVMVLHNWNYNCNRPFAYFESMYFNILCIHWFKTSFTLQFHLFPSLTSNRSNRWNRCARAARRYGQRKEERREGRGTEGPWFNTPLANYGLFKLYLSHGFTHRPVKYWTNLSYSFYNFRT